MKFDLSTLSDISDGTHIVKVKAKADGYRDSEFSNEVEYTKATSISLDLSAGDLYSATTYPIYYEINGEVTTSSPTTGDGVTITISPNDYVEVAAASSSHKFKTYQNKVYITNISSLAVNSAGHSLNGTAYKISNINSSGYIKFWVDA